MLFSQGKGSNLTDHMSLTKFSISSKAFLAKLIHILRHLKWKSGTLSNWSSYLILTRKI